MQLAVSVCMRTSSQTSQLFKCWARSAMANVNCASTLLLLFFFKDILDRSVLNSKFDWAFGKIKRLAMQSFALAYAADSAAIAMEDGQFLTVLASGAVCGLVGLLTSIHRSIATSWQHMWNGMLEENHLSMDWGEEVPLLDLIFFAFTVVKFRRRKNKAAWTGKTLATLKQIQIWHSWLSSRRHGCEPEGTHAGAQCI